MSFVFKVKEIIPNKWRRRRLKKKTKPTATNVQILAERILLKTKKSGNRERCRKLSLWNRSLPNVGPIVFLLVVQQSKGWRQWFSICLESFSVSGLSLQYWRISVLFQPTSGPKEWHRLTQEWAVTLGSSCSWTNRALDKRRKKGPKDAKDRDCRRYKTKKQRTSGESKGVIG